MSFVQRQFDQRGPQPDHRQLYSILQRGIRDAVLPAGLKLPPTRLVKTLIVDGAEKGSVVALVLRGDHDLNAVKAQKLPGVSSPLRMASAESVLAATGQPRNMC